MLPSETTSPVDVTARTSSSDVTPYTNPPTATTCPVDVTTARRMSAYSDVPVPPSYTYLAGNYLYLMMMRMDVIAIGRGVCCYCIAAGFRGLLDVGYSISSRFQEIRPTQVFFWVSLVLMAVLLGLINTNQTRPSVLNRLSPFLVIFCSTLAFLLSTFALGLRAFVWPSRGPLRKLGLTQSLFWYVIGVMGCAYVDSLDTNNSLGSFFLLAVLSIPFSNVILHTSTNLGLMDSLVGLCAGSLYKIVKQKVVGFFVTTFLVVGFAIAKFYSESYKSRYGEKDHVDDDDDIEKGCHDNNNNEAYVKINALGYATRNIIESLQTGLGQIEGSINTSIHKAIDQLLGAYLDRGVITEMVRRATQDASTNVIGDLEAILLPQLLHAVVFAMGPVTQEMTTAIMGSATNNIRMNGFTQMYASSPETTAGGSAGYTIPLTKDEVKEMFSNGTKNDHEASGSGT